MILPTLCKHLVSFTLIDSLNLVEKKRFIFIENNSDNFPLFIIFKGECSNEKIASGQNQDRIYSC